MFTTTINEASKDFSKMFNNTIANSLETIIVSDYGSAVLISQLDWNTIQETLRLFKDKKSLRALLESPKARDENMPVIQKSL